MRSGIDDLATLFGRFGIVALLALAAAGCDKCGNRIRLDGPSIQHACGDQPAH